ncbi:MAG: hypothetical protein H0U79_06250 [Solirubrobacterales bacterium]|nr:hypothetical protein [Solirubrobacterales bacterium]
MTLYDGADPSVSSVGGSLITTDPKHGTESLVLTASDAGSGLYQAIVEVDGDVAERIDLDDNAGRCVDADPRNADAHEFEHRQPCKWRSTAARSTWRLAGCRRGRTGLRVRVLDASGNSTHVHGPATIVVDNVPAPTATQAPYIDGDAQEERSLRVAQGTWSNMASIAVQ